MFKFALQVVLILRRFYWWLVRPVSRGARAIVVNEIGEIILVRHKYGEGLFLPGGKVGKNENDEDALRRELAEELGIVINGPIKKFGEYQNNYEYKKDTIIIFVVKSFNMLPKRHFEIDEWKFVNPKDLPRGTSPGTRRRIEEWLGQRPISDQW